jgi:hypothetical protein
MTEDDLQATRRAEQENNELQANPAHPPTVQGSDEGRAQGEAASEEKANQKAT